jgi:hypothetical protein
MRVPPRQGARTCGEGFGCGLGGQLPDAGRCFRPARIPGAGLQWDHWWSQALREELADNGIWPPDLSSWWTPPAFESLRAAPELQAIVAANLFDAVRWSKARHQAHGTTMHSSVGALFETRRYWDVSLQKRMVVPVSGW